MTTIACAIGPSSVSETSIWASQPAGVIACKRDGAAGQLHGRPARRHVDHADVAPEHAAPEPGAERLGAGLLGGETLGVGFHSPWRGASALARSAAVKMRREKALAVAFDRLADAARVDDVGTEADDHTFPGA